MDTYPGDELGGSYDLPQSRHVAFKHTTVPSFSGQKPAFTAWTRDARYYAKGVGFLSAFVSDPPQYIPVGELVTEHSVLVERGYSRERVHMHALAWISCRRLSRARVTRVSCTSVPRRGKRETLSLRSTALKRRGQIRSLAVP